MVRRPAGFAGSYGGGRRSAVPPVRIDEITDPATLLVGDLDALEAP